LPDKAFFHSIQRNKRAIGYDKYSHKDDPNKICEIWMLRDLCMQKLYRFERRTFLKNGIFVLKRNDLNGSPCPESML